MKTLPPLPRFWGSLTSRVEVPLMSTGPKFVTVNPGVLRGSTGTSPVPATLVTWIVPAGAGRGRAPGVEAGPAATPHGPRPPPGARAVYRDAARPAR